MRKSRLASVQQHYVRAREVQGEVLCLWSPLSPTKRTYRTILEVSPINFLLKAEEEQVALLERYGALLKALTFPIQIFVRNQPLDLRPYLEHIQEQADVFRLTRGREEAGKQDTALWPELASDLETLLKRLGSQHTLLTRTCYLVIPAPESFGPAPHHALWRKKQRHLREEALCFRALQELAVRVETLEQQLQSLGLLARRLHGPDLARFYQSCLTPLRVQDHSLSNEHLRVVGRLPRVRYSQASDFVSENDASETGSPEAEDGIDTGTMGTSHAFIVSPDAQDNSPASDASRTQLRRLRKRRPRHSRTYQTKRDRVKKTGTLLALPSPDVFHLADLLAPGSIQEFPDAVCIGGGINGEEEWVRGIAVTAFPREVSMNGWLAPLLLHDDVLDVVFHLHPQDNARVLRQLKNRRAGYASTRAFNRRYGRLDEPEMEVAASDVQRIMSRLASGEERLFEVSLLVVVRASDRHTLDERSERVASLLHTVFLDAVAHRTTFEHGQALRSALPECRDELSRTFPLDTSSLKTAFPFVSNALAMPGGVLLGATDSGELVLLDPWNPSLENPHCLLCGVTGSGKSTTAKLWIERALLVSGLTGERIWVIDPDAEYLRLARAMGGSVVRIAPGSPQRLNPFDLVPPGYDQDTYLKAVSHGDHLAEKIRDLRRLLNVMLADKGTTLSVRERALLDRALYETYRRVGVSPDPRTHYHQPPLLRDLSDVLKSGVCGPDECDLVLRLSQYIEGSLSGLFSGPTNIDLTSHLLVWDIREMGKEFFPIGIFLIADCIWTQAMYQANVRRALYIDEAATLIEHAEGGAFLADLSRRARKRYLRLVTMTQNPERFVENEHGAVVAANAATKILKRQDLTSVQAVANRLGLTHGEAERLRVLAPNEALALCGDRRVLLTSQISPRELALMTTNPVELAELSQHPQQALYAKAEEEMR